MEENSYKLINPYQLLGVKNNCTISDVKRNYYNLSLLTHPDKGGSQSDFRVVHLAYQYIKKQLENIREVTYEQLEEEFVSFCLRQEEEVKNTDKIIKTPTFYEVNIEANDWLNEFNAKFESQESKSQEESDNPLDLGYGTYMDASEISLDNVAQKLEGEFINDIDYPTEKELQAQNKFTKGIMISFEEPEFMPNYVKYLPLDKTKISDFSNLEGNLKSSDYKLAHTPTASINKNLETEIKKLGTHRKFDTFPQEKIDYQSMI